MQTTVVVRIANFALKATMKVRWGFESFLYFRFLDTFYEEDVSLNTRTPGIFITLERPMYHFWYKRGIPLLKCR